MLGTFVNKVKGPGRNPPNGGVHDVHPGHVYNAYVGMERTPSRTSSISGSGSSSSPSQFSSLGVMSLEEFHLLLMERALRYKRLLLSASSELDRIEEHVRRLEDIVKSGGK